MELIGFHYRTGVPTRICITGNRIAAIEQIGAGGLPQPLDSEVVPVVAPGLVDLQVNGYGGCEFTSGDLDAQSVDRVARALLHSGVTRFLPTLTTHDPEVLTSAAATIARYRATNQDSPVVGIHLEGPFITPEDGPRGAHPAEHVRPPDWDLFCRIQEAADGLIRIVTLSPEYPEAVEFIRRAVDSGVVVSVGHTRADSAQIAAAVDAGARMSTHLGNGAHAVLPRHPNYIWDQLAEDRLTAGLIGDGFHLPPPVLKCFVRAKRLENCVLVSDLSGFAGMRPGQYDTQLGAIEVLNDGRIVIAGQRTLLAAASEMLATDVCRAAFAAEIPLADAWDMAARTPARLLGHEPAEIIPGAPADVVLAYVPVACLAHSEWPHGGAKKGLEIAVGGVLCTELRARIERVIHRGRCVYDRQDVTA